MKLQYILLAAVITGFAACQKAPDASILQQPVSSCKLDKAIFFDDQGGVSDTTAYVYTGDQATRVNYVSYFVTLEYTNNKVSKRSIHDYTKPDSTVLFDQFIYNADGTLSQEKDYANIPSFPIPYLYATYNYTYSGGKVQQLLIKSDTSGTGVLVNVYQTDYTYNGSNISKAILKDLSAGIADTLTYSYDSKQNYYTKNPVLFYTDDLFMGSTGESLPFALSSNNVTGVTAAGSLNNIVYTADGKQNFSELDINGKKAVTYSYKCQ